MALMSFTLPGGARGGAGRTARGRRPVVTQW